MAYMIDSGDTIIVYEGGGLKQVVDSTERVFTKAQLIADVQNKIANFGANDMWKITYTNLKVNDSSSPSGSVNTRYLVYVQNINSDSFSLDFFVTAQGTDSWPNNTEGLIYYTKSTQTASEPVIVTKGAGVFCYSNGLVVSAESTFQSEVAVAANASAGAEQDYYVAFFPEVTVSGSTDNYYVEFHKTADRMFILRSLGVTDGAGNRTRDVFYSSEYTTETSWSAWSLDNTNTIYHCRDVDINSSTISDGQVLTWNSTDNKWNAETPAITDTAASTVTTTDYITGNITMDSDNKLSYDKLTTNQTSSETKVALIGSDSLSSGWKTCPIDAPTNSSTARVLAVKNGTISTAGDLPQPASSSPYFVGVNQSGLYNAGAVPQVTSTVKLLGVNSAGVTSSAELSNNTEYRVMVSNGNLTVTPAQNIYRCRFHFLNFSTDDWVARTITTCYAHLVDLIVDPSMGAPTAALFPALLMRESGYAYTGKYRTSVSGLFYYTNRLWVSHYAAAHNSTQMSLYCTNADDYLVVYLAPSQIILDDYWVVGKC